MVDFTIAIPTYNGEQRLPEVLECLRSQVRVSIAWEVIVVDNNSSDGTAKVVQSFQAGFPCPIRYCLERRQGAAYARQRAVHEAQSDLIGFLDDDNLPDPDWVVAAYQFAQTHPQAGAYGSRIRGAFEVEPPRSYKPILPFLAITERGSEPLRYESQKKLLPPTAGLVIRKQAWLENVPEEGILSRLKFKRDDGNHCGEDLEALSYIQRSHWEIWYNPDMKVAHKIPASRLEKSYLMPLFRSIGLSRHVTRMLSVKAWQRPFMFFAYLGNDLRKIAVLWIKHRSQLKTELALACQLELYIGSVMSPFYLWKRQYFSQTSSPPAVAETTLN